MRTSRRAQMAGAFGRLLTVAALAGVASTSNSASASRPRLGPFGAAGEKAHQPKSTSWSSRDLVKQAVASSRSTSSSSGGHGVHRAAVAVGECFVEKPHPMSRGCTWQLGYCRVGTNMWTGNCTAWRGDRINKVTSSCPLCPRSNVRVQAAAVHDRFTHSTVYLCEYH
jgi:hypothetical protein